MPWLQIRYDVPLNLVEPIEDLMLEQGCSAVTMIDGADEPILEPIRGTTPLWQQTSLVGLYDAEFNTALVTDAVSSFFSTQNIEPCKAKIEILEDKDWEREWMENFHPIACGENLWVCPSWREPVDKNAVNLLLDPGLAFGTGTHPTTFLCLKWLDSQNMKGKTVVDFGCGSGILGIAALLLGADYFHGCDNDPQAVTATAENAKRNNINSDQYLVELPEDYQNPLVDVVMANILAGPLISLAEQLCQQIKPGGDLVLSGILEHQAQEVIAAYEPFIEFSPIVSQDEWVRLNGIRKS